MSGFFIKFFALAFGVLLATGLFVTSYVGKIEKVRRTSEVKINEQIIVAEVVSGAKEREQGLSGRSELGINEGMLFLFDDPGVYGFWMKGMNFPLDIIWIAGTEVVGVEENVPPEPGVSENQLKVYYPPEPVNKVLEVKAGRARLLRAKAGDEVKIRPLIAK
ncbi:MAG: DUF192 domain-containing protein [Candidatus Brennerbacteria bacterium]|nr:DUF192 domain-containing protein [Candidatus Brennerbacteria bacterium]